MLRRTVFINKIKDAATNAGEYYQTKQHTHAHDVSCLPTLIRASVVNFVIVCKVHLSV
jgi:hypothetical protein